MLTTPVILTAVGYFLFSAAVGAMYPPTDEQKPRLYGWFYRFLQRLAANADRLVEAKFGHSGDTSESSVSLATTVTRESTIAVSK